MSFLITILKTPDDKPTPFIVTGDRNALMDAAYDSGALGVSIKELP